MKQINLTETAVLTREQQRVLDLINFIESDQSPGFNMGAWAQYLTDLSPEEIEGLAYYVAEGTAKAKDLTCRTACCIGGHLEILLLEENPELQLSKDWFENLIDNEAASLGMAYEEYQEDLCHPVFVVDGDHYGWDCSGLTKDMAVEVLTYYLNTWLETGRGTVDWRRAFCKINKRMEFAES